MKAIQTPDAPHLFVKVFASMFVSAWIAFFVLAAYTTITLLTGDSGSMQSILSQVAQSLALLDAQPTGVGKAVLLAHETFLSSTSEVSEAFGHWAPHVGQALGQWGAISRAQLFSAAFGWSMVLVALKCLLLVGAYPLYIALALLGTLDGLFARYKRTVEGGRESTFIFHRVAGWVAIIPAVLLFCYCLIPVTSSCLIGAPELMVLLLCLIVGLIARMLACNLKKFL